MQPTPPTSADVPPVEVTRAGATELDVAVAGAVVGGLEVVDRLAETVTGALDRCLAMAVNARARHKSLPGAGLITEYDSLLRDSKQEADNRFKRQRTRLATFNLVLFGRTGAGKSSLIEALSGGDGAPISQGESDWTTDVRDVRWRGSRLVDTPGIGGWGRSAPRADLELRAEAAVADADVVLLCFDTQSQQDGEFAKVAEWIARYGKPVIVVLNSRSPHWHHPLKAMSQSRRRDLSQSVLEHAGHIRDELGRLGLADVPVVAIHSKRAAFARTTDPYDGPDAVGRIKQREEFGSHQLLEWSNLPALEMLLTEALTEHAAQLRLGMLHEQAAGILGSLVSTIRAERQQSVALAEQLERGIADVLGIVGMPADKELAKRVRQLEKLRGGFGIAGKSELLRHAGHRLSASLRQARTDALRRSDRVVESAFDERSDLDSKAFNREVLDPARGEVAKAAKVVGGEVQRYLAQRLELAADDVQADVHAVLGIYKGADATAGGTTRIAGLVLQTMSGLASVGIGIALLGWNPLGWVIGAVTVGGMVISYVGGRFRKKAVADRTIALSEARSEGRRTVNETFDRFERVISKDLSRILAHAAHERLASEVGRALALRGISGAASTAERELRQVAAALPPIADASHLLADLARDIERRRYPGEPAAGRLLWLGESWCDDPNGLTESNASHPVAVTIADRPRSSASELRLRMVIDATRRTPAPQSGGSWVSATRAALADDEVALNVLEQVVAATAGATARLVVAGDYSTGKSSLIKRLLADSGFPILAGLEVAAQPSTERSALYEWGDWTLVDTPGFQSARTTHSDAAHAAVVGASILIVLFNPNLIVGADTDLVGVLLGDKRAGRIGKLPRTLFVINRADELGIDPSEDLAGYENLCRRKELELVQALGAIAGPLGAARESVQPEQVVCVASDPYGLIGDRRIASRADYDKHRDWDGMDELRLALADASTAALDNSGDLQVLERGAVALADLIISRRNMHARLEEVVAQSQRLLLDLDACVNAGHAIHADARNRLVSASVSFVARLFDDIAAATNDKDLLSARVDRLKRWSEDPELQQDHREWATRFERELLQWQDDTSARIEARLTSAAFVSAFAAGDTALDVDHLKPKPDPIMRDTATEGAKHMAEFAAKAPRETVTAVAHAFGHKFRPWGATKLTDTVNKAGGALGVAFGAYELYSTWHSTQKESGAEKTTRELRSKSLREVRDATEHFFDSTGADAPGSAMAVSLQHVRKARDEHARQLDDAITDAAALAERIERCEQALQDALARLEITSA